MKRLISLPRIVLAMFLVSAFSLALPQTLYAANGTWTSTTSGALWSGTGNWSGGIVASGSGSTANFNTIDIAADVTVHLNGDRTLTNLIFGDADTSSAAGWILDNNGSSTNNLILSGTTPTITVNTLGSGASVTISAAIQGSAGLSKAGAGTLVLAGNNTGTGATSVGAGTLKLGAAGALGDGVNNTSSVTMTGSAILDMGGISPTANVPLNLNSTANAFDVGAFTNSGTATATYGGPVTLQRQTRIGGTGGITLTGLVTGGGFNFIKDSTSTLTLANSGTVALGFLQSNRGTVQVNSGTILNVTGINVGSGNSVGATLTLNGGLVASTGTAQFGTGSGSASGNLTLTSGTLTVPGITKGTVTFNANFNGGTLKANASSVNFLNAATAAKVLTGGAFIDDGGFAITIAQPLISGTANDGGLTKSGTGTLTLAGSNTYSGSTRINAGTVAVSSSTSIPSNSDLLIAAGSLLDLSAIPNYEWSAAASLTATGNSTLAAGIKGGIAIDLGTVPVALNFTPTTFSGDSLHPALNVPAGALILSGSVTVTNNGASPLGSGIYVLIRQTVGNLSGSPALSGTVGGQGIQAGRVSFVQVTGGNLELVVDTTHTTATTLSRHAGTGAATTYGDTLQFDVSVSPATANGAVELRDGGVGGTLIGTGTLTGGSCSIIPADTALLAGTHANIVARYLGQPNNLPSTSAALSPAQAVSPKALTISGAAAQSKFYDTTTAASLVGTLAGVEIGDVVTLNPTGTFAIANAGANIAVTSTATIGGVPSANYTLTQPTGLKANIYAAHAWTATSGSFLWDTPANWSSGVVPNGSSIAVTFSGQDIAADKTVHLSSSHTINNLTFGDANTGTAASWTLDNNGNSANILTFSGTSPTITVNPLGTGAAVTISAVLAGSSGLSKAGAGMLILSGTNTFSGGLTISAGTVTANTSSALGTGGITNSGTLNLNAGAVNYNGLSASLSGTGVINVTLGAGTDSTLLNGNYSGFTGTWNIGIGAAASAGKVQMNGLDNAAATINVLSNGTLFTSAGTHRAAIVLNGGATGESFGQLRVEGGAVWAGNVTLAGDMTGSGDGTVGANSGTGTISGNIGESGGSFGLSKVGGGTIVLAGTTIYSGTTTVNAGTLRVTNPGVLGVQTAVTVNATLTGNGIVNGPVTIGLNGIVSGTLTLNGPVTTGSGGTLTGDVIANGAVTIDPGGTLDATDTTSPTLNATSSLTINGVLELSVDRTRTPAASSLAISGTLVRGGTLSIVNTGPDFQLGDTFTLVISAAQVTGSFASTLLPALGYGLKWDTSQLASNGTIAVVANTTFTPSTVTLTPATTNQQIHGIGANFCLGPQGIAWNTSQFNLAFSSTGLNITFVRLANSFECWKDEPSIFWSGWDSDNVRFIQMYRTIQPNGLITMSAWSPPGSFKSTGSAMGGTLAKSGTAYRYADYANWWLRSLQCLRDNSTLPVEQAIPDFISIQNEPDFTPGGTFYAAWQAGCYLDSTQSSTKAGYPQALAAVKNAFQANGFGFVQFIGPDTTTGGSSTISSYLNALPGGSLTAIAHHPYQGSTNDVGHNTGSLSGLRSAYPSSTIYMTEFFGDDSYGAGVPGWMMHCLPMHNIFTIEKANTYLMWGLSLSPTSDSFCALGHYSKFIRPGDWRSAASDTDANVKVSLYRHPVATGVPDQLILVMINNSAGYSYPTVQTSSVWTADPARRLWQVYKTADDGSTSQRLTLTESLSGAALSGNRNLVLAPYSITTVIINSDAAPTNIENWRIQYFGAAANVGTAADTADPNKDGETNLFEFATGQNPNAATRKPGTLVKNGANLEFTYTRSDAAMADGVTFVVEWSDTLAASSWSSTGASETILTDNGTLQTVKATIPAGTGNRRFVRLKISKP